MSQHLYRQKRTVQQELFTGEGNFWSEVFSLKVIDAGWNPFVVTRVASAKTAIHKTGIHRRLTERAGPASS
jgi:hypothetical protein